jgi:hypothetical protein
MGYVGYMGCPLGRARSPLRADASRGRILPALLRLAGDCKHNLLDP